MRCLAILFVAMPLFAPAAAQTAVDEPFTSSMIDRSLFRDGEVRRTAETYGGWTLLCDDVPRLGRKFCSLRAAPAAPGAATIELTISNGDDGRPAALLRLPFGLALAPGVVIEAGGRERPRHVPIALCDAAGCAAVWTLTAAELDALRRGAGLRVVMQGWTPSRRSKAAAPAPMMVDIPGIGFPEALAASLR